MTFYKNSADYECIKNQEIFFRVRHYVAMFYNQIFQIQVGTSNSQQFQLLDPSKFPSLNNESYKCHFTVFLCINMLHNTTEGFYMIVSMCFIIESALFNSASTMRLHQQNLLIQMTQDVCMRSGWLFLPIFSMRMTILLAIKKCRYHFIGKIWKEVDGVLLFMFLTLCWLLAGI